MKNFLLKTWLTMICLLFGVGTMWAETKTITPTGVSGDVIANVISFTTAKNDGTADPAFSSSAIRLYQCSSANVSTGKRGGSIIFEAADGYVINKVTISNQSSNDANGPTVAYLVDGAGSWQGSSTVAKGGNYSTSANLGATSVEIACFGTTNKTRLYITSITVEYVSNGGGSSEPVDASWSVDPTSVTVKATKTATTTITTNYNGTLSVSSANSSIATASIEGKVITVTGVAEGTTTLNVTGTANSSYNSISKSIAVTVTANTITPGSYDITPNNDFWGSDYSGSFNPTANNLTLNGESDDISVQLKNGSSTNGYITNTQTRVYSNYTMKFSVPTGYDITGIAFTADSGNNWAGTHTASTGTMTDSKHWTGAANEVTITFKGTCRIEGISVTYAMHEDPAEAYTVSFNASTNGSCGTTELTEESAGAGVTLPNVTANAGWDFVGWSTSATPSSANAGVAGSTYYPSEDCTLYAYYTKQIPTFSGSYVDFDLTSDNTATATEEEMTWISDIVNIAAAKAESSTDANNYYPGSSTPRSSTRFYAKSTLTFTPVAGITITGIEYTATQESYATEFANSTWTNSDAVASKTTAYVTPTNGTQAVSATIGATTGGTKFRVYYTGAPEPTPVNGTLNFVAYNNSGYWATFSSDKNVIFDASDVVVYTVAVDNNELVNNEAYDNSYSCVTDKTKDEGWVAGYYVQANTGVLIYSIGESVNYYYIDTDPYTANDLNDIETDPEYNMLRAASVEMETEGYKFYKLAYNNYANKTGLGFYWGATDGARFTAKEGGAYLAVPVSAGASNMRGFSFEPEGHPTGVESISNEVVAGEIYNLQGQRINHLQQGVNIVNGRKVIR